MSLFQWSAENGVFVFNSTLSSGSAIRVENVPDTGKIDDLITYNYMTYMVRL